ncbi:MAG: formate--tetrahydrofolate ligase [Calditrichia bacterium]
MKTDIQIAHEATLRDIREIASTVGLRESDLELYGPYKAKVKLDVLEQLKNRPDGTLILVSAITPTPAGEGKTTVSIGLTQGLAKIGKKAVVALREPSLGPTFGKKGGATGGGYSQVLPMEDINLHFTGDFHAVTYAHNLLAAMIDNHIHQGNELGIDPRRILWKRVIDLNDRSLRDIVIGLGGTKNGFPRETGFDITAASEIMAILTLSNNYEELKEKLGNILIGFSYSKEPVYARDLHAENAMAVLLKDAIKPNLVQTIEGVPALIHGGPFANIAQGTNSILATKMALKLGEYAITEAGFGFDLGAEKFFDIVSPYGGFCPAAVVLVATIRALKMHGGKSLDSLAEPDLKALEKGLENLDKHLENIAKFGMKAVVAINRFHSDTDEEISLIKQHVAGKGFKAVVADVWAEGGNGAIELAEAVVESVSKHECEYKPLYDWKLPVEEKIRTVAKEIYGAEAIDFTKEAKNDLKEIERLNLSHLPVCIAKTQKSLSDNPKLLGRPKDFLVTVRNIIISSGAGFLVPLTGDIMRMPGLPKEPAAEKMSIDEHGNIDGMF